jgi:DNA repair protein RadA/Sms
MASGATVHVCSECGHTSPQWHGRCPGCEAWGTLLQEAAGGSTARVRGRGASRGRSPSGEALRTPRPLREVTATASSRLSTGIGEFDRVLGGGLVPGSLVLLGGSPGIGKSTLTNMALGNLARAGHTTVYVSAEESAEQVRLRAERLVSSPGDPANPGDPASVGDPANPALDVPVLAETDLDAVLDTLATHRPQVCVIDSVQTLRCSELAGAPGTVGQVREVTGRIMELAKELSVAIVLVGHVTKDGVLAGPRALEHLVDCVLQFEGERERPYRELRALKNRFGSTNEAGLFEMRQEGLA